MVKKPKKADETQEDRVNAMSAALIVDLEALLKKHGLTTLVSVCAVGYAGGSHWAAMSVGDSAPAETMFAWAQGRATVQRQQNVARLMIGGAISDRSKR